MSSESIAREIALIEHILETVPFAPGGVDSKIYFLDVYKLKYSDIKSLNLNETTWEQYRQVAVNRLLKLAISFGNLIKSFEVDKAAYDAKIAQQRNFKNTRPGVDPFTDSYKPEKSLLVAPYFITFARNLSLILKNFDIGTPVSNGPSRASHASRSSVGLESDSHSFNGSQGSSSGALPSSPIRLNSRQLLIEKLEINIRLDALFTLKIVFKLLLNIFARLKELVDSYSGEEVSELATIRAYSESSSIFSSASGGSGGADPVHNMEDYVRLVREIIHRIKSGIVDPFTNLLLTEIVESRVINGFQNLVSTI